MEDGGGLTAGTDGLRSAPELHTRAHAHTHTQAHARTPPPRRRARRRPPGGACGSASCAPLFPTGPRLLARARALAYPARSITRTLRPLAGSPAPNTAVRPQDSRAQPRPPCIYQANAAPPAANRGARGARPAARTFKATFSCTAPARGQLSGLGAPARLQLAADGGHAGERRGCLRGWDAGPGALQEDC